MRYGGLVVSRNRKVFLLYREQLPIENSESPSVMKNDVRVTGFESHANIWRFSIQYIKCYTPPLKSFRSK